MLTSLGLIFLVGLSAASICTKCKLPRIIGMLATGILLGPYLLDLLDPTILGISAELRQLALVIILMKAGLSLNIADLKRVGRPALLLAFLPASLEVLAYTLFAPLLLGVSTVEAALMGAVLSAVSPAVVVPRMVYLIEHRIGTDKSIPQMILAGASLDDVYVIVLFTTFTNMALGGSATASAFAQIPISILTGVMGGAIVGWLVARLFSHYHNKHASIRNSIKVIILLSLAFLLLAAQTALEEYVSFSGLLAIVSMACVLRICATDGVAAGLSDKFGKLWLAAELVLFVLVGAAVDIRYTFAAGLSVIVMIFLALIIRSVGVFLALLGTALNCRERMFCVIAYLPKATVQAAIGAVPLALGLECGTIILSVAVLAILITAPLGALGMERTFPHWLYMEQAIEKKQKKITINKRE